MPFKQEDRRRAAPPFSAVSTPKIRSASLPSPGKITRLRTPGGPFVRNDCGVYEVLRSACITTR